MPRLYSRGDEETHPGVLTIEQLKPADLVE